MCFDEGVSVEFDVIIKDGTVVDGTGLPRYRADIGIKDGVIAEIGRLSSADAKEVLDAGGHVVAPGFIDVHTHYDGQIFWDPYCTTSGWHGVTGVVLGNCGFGFAPVEASLRDRSMLAMSRNEQIPFDALKAGMPWDWETYPEFLDSLDRTPKGVNLISYVPISPLMIWVMGLDQAKSGRPPTDDETTKMQALLDEAMRAGGCGWSAQRSGQMSLQADYDGTPFPTDVMGDELCYSFAEVLKNFNYGAIEHSPLSAPDFENMTSVMDLAIANPHDREVSERLAEVSGRPVIHNLVGAVHGFPEAHRTMLQWLADCHARGNRVIGQGATLRAWLTFTLENNQTFDISPPWREGTIGTREEQLAKLKDPEHRAKMIEAEGLAGLVIGGFASLVVAGVDDPERKAWVGSSLGDVAAEIGKTPVEAFIDLSVETDFGIEFTTGTLGGTNPEGVGELMRSPYIVPGPSDGGAHVKFTTGGTFGTDLLTWLVRDEEQITLEDAHFHLSYLPAQVAGFRDRGFLRVGAPADIVVYDLEKLELIGGASGEKVHDFPANEWRRIQRSKGYRYTLVNGVVTFEDGACTDATPGRLLRCGAG
jgi:N-acyl-D-amino-acid deacylase